MKRTKTQGATTRESELPEIKVLTFNLRPDQGFAQMALSMQAPPGYRFESMNRTGTEAKITYRRVT